MYAHATAESMQRKLGAVLFDTADEHVPESEPDFFDQHKGGSGKDLSVSLAKVGAFKLHA